MLSDWFLDLPAQSCFSCLFHKWKAGVTMTIYGMTLIEISGLLVIVVSYILFGIWADKVDPTNKMIKKYSRYILLQSRLPFATKWRKKVDVADQAVCDNYRKRIFLLFIYFLISLGFIYGYLWIKFFT